jgi:hypothetical protein
MPFAHIEEGASKSLTDSPTQVMAERADKPGHPLAELGEEPHGEPWLLTQDSYCISSADATDLSVRKRFARQRMEA